MLKIVPICLLLLGVASIASGAPVYKWTDSNGNTVYSDKPPLDRPSELIRVAPSRGVRNPGSPAAPVSVGASAPSIITPLSTNPDNSPASTSPNSAPSAENAAGSAAGGTASGGGSRSGGGGGGSNAGVGSSKPSTATPSSGGAIPPIKEAAATPSAPAPATPPPRPIIDLGSLTFGEQVIGPIPREYFGIHFHNPEKLPAVLPIDFGSWRTWDSGVTWEHLEPKPGQWDFSRLDQVVDIAQRNNIQLLYTFGIVPRWASSRPDDPFVYGPGGAAKPRNIADWENYVRTVAMRYKGRIKYYELWNEPSVTELEPNPKGFWHNSAADLLELGVAAKRVLQQVDPNAKLLSPGFVGGFTRIDLYFKQGGSRAIGTADIVAFHFYSPSPERMFTYIDKMKALLEQRGIGDRPLWNTETGYTISSKKNVGDEVYMPNQETAAAYLSRSLILGAAKGLERFYWYAYEGESSGISVNGQMDLRGFAYATTMRWLKGAMLEGCASPDSVKWVCQLSRGSRKAWIAWATSGDADFIVNGGASPAVEFETISGQVNTLDSHGGPIPLGISPILVKTDSGAWSN